MRDLLFAVGLLSIFAASIAEYLSYSSVSVLLWLIGVVIAGIVSVKDNVV